MSKDNNNIAEHISEEERVALETLMEALNQYSWGPGSEAEYEKREATLNMIMNMINNKTFSVKPVANAEYLNQRLKWILYTLEKAQAITPQKKEYLSKKWKISLKDNQYPLYSILKEAKKHWGIIWNSTDFWRFIVCLFEDSISPSYFQVNDLV